MGKEKRQQSKFSQVKFNKHQTNINKHSTNIQQPFNKHSTNIQQTFNKHSINMQQTCNKHSTNINNAKEQSLYLQLMLFVPLALPTQRPGVHGYMGYCVKLSLVMFCRQKFFFNKGKDNPILLHCVSPAGHA